MSGVGGGGLDLRRSLRRWAKGIPEACRAVLETKVGPGSPESKRLDGIADEAVLRPLLVQLLSAADADAARATIARLIKKSR